MTKEENKKGILLHLLKGQDESYALEGVQTYIHKKVIYNFFLP
jgi:hypothetical protein